MNKVNVNNLIRKMIRLLMSNPVKKNHRKLMTLLIDMKSRMRSMIPKVKNFIDDIMDITDKMNN